LQAKLVENKYEVKTIDFETGFLVAKPRSFMIGASKERRPARQIVQIRQEGGSVKVRTIYECEYDHENGKFFEPCLLEDQDATAKIQRVDGLLQKLVRDNLNKHGSP
jgi:hypothetical protein